ncbi:MAG: sensor histidine kinase [Candidatus Wenzhouxiangella sp. M2_3B_020]
MQLVENLLHVHEEEAGSVRLDFTIEEVDLPPEVAVPLGLILNEFTVNSLKHAFDGSGGCITVSVERRGPRGLTVSIEDNGAGMPADRPAAARGAGTGMRLIEGLARQIEAEPTWSTADPGTRLELKLENLTL